MLRTLVGSPTLYLWSAKGHGLVHDMRSLLTSQGPLKKGTGFPHDHDKSTNHHQVSCLRVKWCDADAHDIRASLIYSCENCTHEWQIDPAEEPQQADPIVAERARTPSRSAEGPHTP